MYSYTYVAAYEFVYFRYLPVDRCLPVEEARKVLQAYCYQASSYVLPTVNNGSCDIVYTVQS